MAEFHSGLGKEAWNALFNFEPLFVNSEACDGAGPIVVLEPVCVVTTGIGVVHSPCDRIKGTEPVLPARGW